MVFEQEPRFIFVHIPRTGGTSIENALSRHLLSKDLGQLTVSESHEYYLPGSGLGLQHAKLFEIEQRRRTASANYLTFAFVRNPWDLVASEIAYLSQVSTLFTGFSWKDCVRKIISYSGDLFGHDFSPQTTYLRGENGKMGVKLIGRFETLQHDFCQICRTLKLPKLPLPHLLRTSHRRPHYTELYDVEMKNLVAKHFAADIEEFGYRFCART